MSHRDNESVEVARWKKKFLDSLEVNDTHEKSFKNRIKLLRRGLVGVSLAGDGLDAGLDRELASLRATLRAQDSEAGIEPLLERIEKSVLRLDTRKEESISSIKSALNLSVKQLQELQLSRELKRGVKQYAKNLQAKVKDPQSHSALVVDFLELLRMVVRELTATADSEPAQAESGFWARLFSGGTDKPEAPAAPTVATPEAAPAPISAPAQNKEVPKAEPESKSEPEPEQFAADVLGAAPSVANASNTANGPETKAADSVLPVAEAAVVPSPASNDIAPDRIDEQLGAQNSDSVTAQTQGEDAPLNAKNTEPEPGFSAIADHAEPALLRIVDNIHVPEQSIALAARIRSRIEKGLNWYEFVSVLEDIYALINAALEQERTEFQRFLNELNQSLGQVQEYVHFSKEQEGASRESERALDDAVRTQISEISDSVHVAEDIGELKTAVQGQLSTILSSMDTFKDMKRQQQESANEHSQQLEARLATLEQESKELRLHLAQQEKLASRDALTELPNRANYDRRVQEEAAKWREGLAQNNDQQLCLGVCDVDHFKRINDTYGHLAGDKVLKILAKEISTSLGEENFVARYGGEEFTLLMPGISLDEAEELLNKVRQKIERCPFHFKEEQVQITMSFGLSIFANDDTPEAVFERADKALYRAKEGGRNQVCLASPPEAAPKG